MEARRTVLGPADMDRMIFRPVNAYFVSILRARSMTFGFRAPKLYPAATVRHRTR
jgi:hypothetical protein